MMSAGPAAALLLAGAVAVLPKSSLGRITPQRPVAGRTRVVVGATGVIAAIGLIVLPLPAVLAALILLAGVELHRRRYLQQRRQKNESSQLATALEILIAELRIGAHPARAFSVAGADSSAAVGDALRAVSARALLGGDVVDGLRAVAAGSVIATHWNRLAICWNLADQRGLALSPLMRAAQRDISERQRYTARMEAGLAGARATAVILAGLPVVGVLLGQLVGAHPVELLFGDGVGGWLLFAGVVLVCLGLFWADRITNQLQIADRRGAKAVRR